MKICPECGSQRFRVTAHVTQDWEVDENGSFIKCMNECEEVTHAPDNDDIWQCAECGFDAAGRVFNFPDQTFISKEMIRKGLESGCIRLGNEDGDLSAHIGEHWFWFNSGSWFKSGVLDHSYTFTDVVFMIYQTINDEPIRNTDEKGNLDEEGSPEYMYYFHTLRAAEAI